MDFFVKHSAISRGMHYFAAKTTLESAGFDFLIAGRYAESGVKNLERN